MFKHSGIYWQENEIPNLDACSAIYEIDCIIEKLNFIENRECRELSLAVTKLNEAQLWLTQISG